MARNPPQKQILAVNTGNPKKSAENDSIGIPTILDRMLYIISQNEMK